jgi:hypothetical protein
MGFAVDDFIDLPSGYVPGEVEHHAAWSWPQPYAHYAALIGEGGGVARVAAAAHAALTRLVSSLAEGDAALLISHGGIIEPALVGCLPDADHGAWGAPFGHCDGARLFHDGGAFVGIEFRRAPR